MKEINVVCEYSVSLDGFIVTFNSDKNYYEVLLESEKGSILVYNLKNISFDGMKIRFEGKALCEENHHATLTGIRNWDDK